MGLIPTSVFSAFAENDILQVLLFSVLFGSALNLVGEQASGVARLINEFSHIVFRIMGMIVRLAPLGVFGAVAFTTARYGVDSLSHLGALVLVFYATRLVSSWRCSVASCVSPGCACCRSCATSAKS